MEKTQVKRLELTTEEKGGELIAIASTEDVDRAGDSLKVKDWDFKNFLANPVLQAGHDYRPQFTVGVAEQLTVQPNGTVTFKPKFHDITPLAKQIGEMYRQKILKAWSVGFIPGNKNELLEVSAVAVPMNPNALTMYKGLLNESAQMDETVVKSIEEWVHQKAKYDEEADPTKEDTADETGVEEIAEEPKVEEVAEEKAAPQVDKKAQDVVNQQFTQLKADIDTLITLHNAELNIELYGDLYEQNQDTSTLSAKAQEIFATKGIRTKKERWNKSLSKAFDVSEVQSRAATFELDIFRKFLDCNVKDIFLNYYDIPSPLLGTYLAGFKSVLGEFELNDTRRFGWDAGEYPPVREVIQLNSTTSDDFLIDGTEFYIDKKSEQEKRMVVKFAPTWSGLSVLIATTSNEKAMNLDVLTKVHQWVKDNNYLKGEKFSLSGEFLTASEETWDDLVLEEGVAKPIETAINQLNKNKGETKSRGMLFVGPPGTGKTKTGRILMKNADTTFVWVSARDFREYSATGAMKLAFELAQSLAPSVLFLEDIDRWLKEYMVDFLKSEMDGIKQHKGMITILTSNSPEELPDALLDRPGRFHDVLEFGLPSAEKRGNMLAKWAGVDAGSDVAKMIVDKTEGYSGAHMYELVQFAKMVQEDEEVGIEEALLKSLTKLQSQRELIQSLRDKKKSFESLLAIAELKEGRVLSTKNLKLLGEVVATIKEKIAALEKLLEDTTPEKKDEAPQADTPKEQKGGSSKGREPKVAEKAVSEDQIILRALQKIAGETSHAIYNIKRKK